MIRNDEKIPIEVKINSVLELVPKLFTLVSSI